MLHGQQNIKFLKRSEIYSPTFVVTTVLLQTTTVFRRVHFVVFPEQSTLIATCFVSVEVKSAFYVCIFNITLYIFETAHQNIRKIRIVLRWESNVGWCVRSPVAVSVHGHVFSFYALSHICFVLCTEVANIMCCDSPKRRYLSLNCRVSHARTSL